MSDNMKLWAQFCRPPETALKQIGGGRLKGMTDIKPQWRMMAMTQTFGAIGFGWKYRVTERWKEEDAAGQVAVFVNVALQVKQDGEWSDDIHGSGGAMLIVEENKTDYETKQKVKALYFSDEAYKMAETDALSVAMKQLGVAADIYMGMFNGSKYTRESIEPDQNVKVGDGEIAELNTGLDETNSDKEAFCKLFKIASLPEMRLCDFAKAMDMINSKRRKMEADNAKS